jgi:uncharacterized membrane protein/thiol-disulfide isomerase/thioredoxin
MNTNRIIILISLLFLMLSLSLSTAGAQEELSIARAILFFSPTCPHCEKVINQDLPPLFDQYGKQLLIIGVNVTEENGAAVFRAALEYIEYPLEEAGVPFLLVGDQVMIGATQIPDELPGLIAEGLAGEGIPWPEIPVILEFLQQQGYLNAEGQDITPTPEPSPTEEEPTPTFTTVPEDTPAPTATEASPPTEEATPPITDQSLILLDEDSGDETIFDTFASRFNKDPLANGIAVVVLLFLIGVAVYIAVQFMRAGELKHWPEWILPVLLVIGIAIAIYLSNSEVTGDEVICGPVGDCNAVQQSEYATLFGILPVAVLGMIGYIVIGGTWLMGKLTSGQTAFYAKMGMFLSALFGLLFFIYLTFLEPFVIGATCAWCITSAITMALINLSVLPIALDAWMEPDDDEDEEEID